MLALCNIWRERRALSKLQHLSLGMGMGISKFSGFQPQSSSTASPLQILSPDIVEMIAEKLEMPDASTCERWLLQKETRCSAEAQLRLERNILAILPSFAALDPELLHPRMLVIWAAAAVLLESLVVECRQRIRPASRLQCAIPFSYSALNLRGALRVAFHTAVGILGKSVWHALCGNDSGLKFDGEFPAHYAQVITGRVRAYPDLRATIYLSRIHPSRVVCTLVPRFVHCKEIQRHGHLTIACAEQEI